MYNTRTLDIVKINMYLRYVLLRLKTYCRYLFVLAVRILIVITRTYAMRSKSERLQ